MTTVAPEVAAAPVLDLGLGAASWRALGTHVDLRTAPWAVERAVEIAAAVLDEVDRTCSRFRSDSDLVRANVSAGSPVPAPPVLVAAVRVALEAADETDGLVDPTLGALLAASGYDRTFTLVPADNPAATSLPVAAGSWRDVRVTDDTLTVPVGAALDLGATGKAFAADLVALAVLEELAAPTLVSVGGDIRVVSPDEGVGPVFPVVLGHSVADLEGGGPGARVRLREGGLATSSTSARRWRRGGRQWHHLIDPRTGGPTTGPWRTVSALGRTAAAANTATTAAVVLGAEAPGWLAHRGVAARLVATDGRVETTPAWDDAALEDEP
jgi:thiamine biosynthesis lipoprotein